jgi:cytochrome c-type biogenesis protein CcsB
MKRNLIHNAICALLIALVACGLAPSRLQAQTADQPATFESQLELKALGQVAVHTEGRVKSLDSHTRAAMQFVLGAPKRGIDPSTTFTYFDLMLRPDKYSDADIIFVKNKPIRAQIVQALRASFATQRSELAPEMQSALNRAISEINPRLDAFIETGRISPKMLNDDKVHELLGRLSSDLLRTAKFVEMIDTAMNVMHPDSLRANLKLIAPPPGSGINDAWLTINDISSPHATNDFSTLDPNLRKQIIDQWTALTSSWANENAPAVNDAANALAQLLPQVNPEIYPKTERLAWESWYFRMHNMTWVWLIYAFALVPLLLGVVFKWKPARWIGLLMFLGAFGLHTFAVMLRWYVADRWPNSNMFEAVTTAAWFGGCFAIVLELLVRKLPMRNIFALGSATASMCALMAVHFLPLQLNPNISNMMPVLNDVWLYIHTNVIIFSYCLIFIAAISALIYLGYRFFAVVNDWPRAFEYARVGGAGSLILTRPDGTSFLDERRATFGQILDGTTMVMMELSFIMLWAGLVMGAIWADHSWGRPWGWDPKEVFALNTFIVFLVLVHVRLKVKDKGLWTALLAVAGACVMLFNWIIINFAISGLHSYA